MSTATLTAEEIGGRVLKLIGAIRSADDIAPDRVERATGIKVAVNPDDHNEYGFGGKLDGAWSYNLVSLTENDGSRPSRLMFSFDDDSRGHADMAPVCTMDFDAYAKALAADGFARTPARGEHDRLLYWDFARGGVSVQVYVEGASETAGARSCVSKLIIHA